MNRTIHAQLRTLKVTVPAGTAIASPTSTTWNLGNVILQDLEVMVPSGHSGNTGVRVDYQGVTIVPFGQPPTWIIASGETIRQAVDVEVGAALTVVAYNVDIFDHSFYWRARVDVFLDAAGPAAPELVDVSAVAA